MAPTEIQDFVLWKCSCGNEVVTDPEGNTLATWEFIQMRQENNINGGRHELNR